MLQSDLFSLLYVDEICNSNLKDSFYDALDFTMFRELNDFLNQTYHFKELLFELFEKKQITDLQIKDSKILIDEIQQKVLELKNSTDVILNNLDFQNQLNKELVDQFYNHQLDLKIKKLLW
ncbi:Uncharacterised protein, partial [Mycoplasma putrefaciens]